MKKIFFFLSVLFFVQQYTAAQSTVLLRGDSIKMYRYGGNAELQIMNATRDTTNGALFNIGNGRTAFKRVMKKLNDSTYLVGGDTLKVKYGSGSGSTNSNIGSGYRFAVPGTNNIKTLFGGFGITLDSTSNANAITAKFDSAGVFPYVWKTYGNTGIDTTNFIGTIDSVPFIIRTHNQFSGTVGSYITGYDNSVITTGNFPYRHGLISLGIGAAKSLPLNNTGGIVVIGTDALKNLHNSSASNNYAANGLVVIGTNAYKYLDSSFYPYGNRSTVIGHWAGHRNFAGEYNTIVGAMNMELNYRGSNNTSVGFSTLRSNIDGGGNVAVGLFSMLYNSTGIDTIPLISGGSGYTYANVTISAPLAGSPGGYVQTATATADVSGGAVTAIRMTNKGAGYSIYPHTYDFGTQGNIVITITGDGTGATAGTPTMISGSNNTCIGTGSGFYNLRGVGNVNLGMSSSNKQDDNYTTLVGYNSVTNSVTGKISNATAIGYNSKVGASNSLVLGGTGVDTVNVGIGTDKPLARLHIASGNIVAQGTTEAYPSTHYLPFNGIGARFMWVNSKRALRAGYVTDNKWDIDSIAHGSVAFGYYTVASGYGSLAQGEYAYARGKAALAVGWQVAANADFSVAFGAGNKSYGVWATSFGLNNIANGNIALATGYGTIAYDGASTFGTATRGKGYYSLASGIGTYTKNYGSASFGTYNDTTDVGSISAIDNANRIFVVGNGTADNARSNALTILQTGKVGIGTNLPDSLLTVSQGIYGQRGLRLPNLPTGKKAKQLYWDTDGTVFVADSAMGSSGLTIGTTTIASSATGSILYDSSGTLSRNADLYWDVSNKRLGIATRTPSAPIHVYKWGSSSPLIALTGMYGTLNIYADASTQFHWSEKLVVDKDLTLGGGLSTAYGKTYDWNAGSFINIQSIDFNGAVSRIKLAPDYNVGSTVANQGVIVKYTNPSSGNYPQAAFQAYSSSDDTDKSFLISSRGFGYLKNSKTDETVFYLKAAASQTANLLELKNSSSTILSSFDKDGKLYLGSSSAPTTTLQVNGTMAVNQGTDVASANNLAVVANSTEITGTTQVNLIANTGWVNGSQITLLLASGITIKNGQTTSGSNITILLDGAADFVTASASSLTLLLSEVGGTQAWREISRRSY